MSKRVLRSEMMGRLRAYLQGEQDLPRILEWEADLSLVRGVSPGLRAQLDQVALLGEEVEAGLRDEAELRELVKSIVDPSTAKARTS